MSEPKPDTGDKPIRVMEGEVVVGKCPLCTKPLTATVEVEVRLGALTIGKAVDEETGEIPVDVNAEPRIRKLKIEHECTAPAVKPRTRKPRTSTPRTPGSAPPAAPPPPMPIEVPDVPPPDSPVWTGEGGEGEETYEECVICEKLLGRYNDGTLYHIDGLQDHDAAVAGHRDERRREGVEHVMSGLQDLGEALQRWVTVERHQGQPEVSTHQDGALEVTEVYAYPEAPEGAVHATFTEAPPDQVRADVHFVEIAPTADFPDQEDLVKTVQAAFGEGEFMVLGAADLSGGPSYIALGGWLGSQELALMLIGAVELAGLAKAITPKVLGVTGEDGDRLAGNGLVMLGPWDGWADA